MKNVGIIPSDGIIWVGAKGVSVFEDSGESIDTDLYWMYSLFSNSLTDVVFNLPLVVTDLDTDRITYAGEEAGEDEATVDDNGLYTGDGYTQLVTSSENTDDWLLAA